MRKLQKMVKSLNTEADISELSQFFQERLSTVKICEYDPLSRRLECSSNIADQVDMSPEVKDQFLSSDRRNLKRWGKGIALLAKIGIANVKIELTPNTILLYVEGEQSIIDDAVDQCRDLLNALGEGKQSEVELSVNSIKMLFRA